MGEQTIGCQGIEGRSYLDVGIERSGLFRQLTLSTPYPALSHDSVANLDFAYTVYIVTQMAWTCYSLTVRSGAPYVSDRNLLRLYLISPA